MVGTLLILFFEDIMRNWKLVLIVVFIVLFPLILNFILQFPPSFDVVGDSVVWLEFWPTYLSAAASFIMIFLTYKMLRQNQMQMNEMKVQRLEDERARLVASIMIYEGAYYLKIMNIGKNNAYDVSISVNDDFVAKLNVRFRQYIEDLSAPSYVEAGKSIYVFLGWCDDLNQEWKDEEVKLVLKGTYNGKYSFTESFDMHYFVNRHHFVVKGDLETLVYYMKKGLVVQNDQYMPVQKSLDMIAKILEKKVDD